MDAEQIREKKMQELKERAEQQRIQQEKEQEMEMQIDSLIRNILTPDAKQRLNNVKLVNKQLYLKVAQSLIYLVKAGQLQGKISEQELKSLLEKASQKRDINIKRK